MLEAPIRNRLGAICLTLAFCATAFGFSSCATEEKHTALISDPDAQRESSIPWNKPERWETGANLPGGLGSGAAGAASQPGVGGY